MNADRVMLGAGDDAAFGWLGDDLIYGNQGNDALDGGDGGDVLYGGQGNDLVAGGAGGDALYGNLGSDTLSAGSGDDVLFGGQGDDALSGEAGDDTLRGNLGADVLVGGDGADLFVVQLDGTGTDTVRDFEPGRDRIGVVSANFGLLPVGPLAATNFSLSSPATAAATFVFNTQTGVLAFDPDGTGSAAAVPVATLNVNWLTSSDIVVLPG